VSDHAELQAERDFLLRSLDDLDAERRAGDLDDHNYEVLRDAYTARAAEVMRELSGEQPPPPAPRRRRTRVTADVVAAALVFATISGLLVAAFAGQRTPGQQVSGTVPGGESALLDQARTLLSKGKALEAVKTYDRVLRNDPKNPEALAYRGWVLKLAGLPDQGLTSIEAAIAADPTYPDAHFFRGMILEQDKHDPAAAVPELRTFLAANPTGDLVPMVQQVLNQALKESGQASS
jgi:tetratricopeptide (TPR) repeat protein